MDSSTRKQRILVVGAGITGASFARMAAERGYRIDVYEQQPRFGGAAERMGDGCLVQFHPPTDTRYGLASRFITHYSDLRIVSHTGMVGYYPVSGWHWFCATLLDHPEIQTLRSATIQNAGACVETYQHIYNTASLDSLFNNCYGKLAYLSAFPIRDEEETNRYLKYRRLAELCNFYNFGLQGGYKILTIEEAVLEAYAALQDLLQRKQKVDATVHQPRFSQGTLF